MALCKRSDTHSEFLPAHHCTTKGREEEHLQGGRQREREKLYIFSSHLGLIRCLTPVRDSAIIYSQAFLDKHCNTTNIILPHKLNHGSCMLSKQPYMPVTNSLKPWAFKYNMLLITQVFTRTQSAYSMQPRDTLPTAKIPWKIVAAQPEPEQALHTAL